MKIFKSMVMALVLVFVLVSGVSAGKSTAWKKVMDRKGVVAYARSVPGSRVLEIRAAGIIPAPAAVLAEVLRDVPAAPEWLPSCSKGELLHNYSRNNMLMRYTMDLPWPVSDRDLVVRSDVKYDLDHARGISNVFVVVDAKYPPNEDIVRITDMEAEYIFEYLGPEKTGMIMTTRVDPAGNLPAFLINLTTKHFAYKQFTALRKMCKLSKYRKMAKGSEDDLLISGIMQDKDQVRGIYRNRLMEISENTEFVDMIVNDDETFNEFYSKGGDSGPVGEVLLQGWGSQDSKKEATAALLGFYLEKKTDDKKTIKKLTEDKTLIECLFSGKGKNCNGVEKQINSRL